MGNIPEIRAEVLMASARLYQKSCFQNSQDSISIFKKIDSKILNFWIIIVEHSASAVARNAVRAFRR
jgi:hypothetical protein